MAADDESDYSSANDDSDPAMITIQIQQRILQLKNDREKRTKAVLQESSIAFDKLRTRVVAYEAERHQKESKCYASHVKALADATYRRKDIEARMLSLVMRMNSYTKELEEMMMKGYLGREEDMKKAGTRGRRSGEQGCCESH
ncbi:hypothetical protein EDB81DRAFT_186536 [Dactylonectria macrodidyma]|uniref:Uncharacterized protein n=1 Tax=Dactylonectria macrodidyma TaxID=307937 RepID=A0A9P9FSK9_9HYPO|nr:hypothetical protein EDB81DRAFT_186536 [Dactylonectria macrodidyma]